MSFDVAADAYDAFMGRYSRPLAPQLVAFAGVAPGQRVLDVGCGTGALVEALLRVVDRNGVAAVDPSASFVAAMRERHPGLEVHEAPAEDLPFADAAFDATLAQLVVHFIPDPVAGLREVARVTRPGGTVAASVWDHAGGNGPLGRFWAAARRLDPGARDESHLPGVRQGHLGELFRNAGLRDVVEDEHVVVLGHASFEEWWAPFERGVGPAGAYVRTLAPDQRVALREACRRDQPDGPFTVRALAWVARGTA